MGKVVNVVTLKHDDPLVFTILTQKNIFNIEDLYEFEERRLAVVFLVIQCPFALHPGLTQNNKRIGARDLNTLDNDSHM